MENVPELNQVLVHQALHEPAQHHQVQIAAVIRKLGYQLWWYVVAAFRLNRQP